MRALGLALLFFSSLGLAACAGETDDEPAATGVDDLVGGRRDLRWSASGYLARGSSMSDLDRSKPACGATLIAPNVAVTAAHCVLDPAVTYAFGTGDVRSGPVVRVAERHVHPEFHAEKQGSFDLVHALRKHDLAYLVLERDVPGVTPAALPDAPPSSGCTIQAIGYRDAQRVSTPACVMFRVTLVNDPIFEVHPQGQSALCVADGDEGSATVQRTEDKTVLVGIYVGSVTQGFTDCRRGTQFLNGYESMFGYREFLNEGIARARRPAGTSSR